MRVGGGGMFEWVLFGKVGGVCEGRGSISGMGFIGLEGEVVATCRVAIGIEGLEIFWGTSKRGEVDKAVVFLRR